jgi:hypothetical protein
MVTMGRKEIGLAAGTQVFTPGISETVLGAGEPSTALLAGAGRVLGRAVAEWIIRRPMHTPSRHAQRS